MLDVFRYNYVEMVMYNFFILEFIVFMNDLCKYIIIIVIYWVFVLCYVYIYVIFKIVLLFWFFRGRNWVLRKLNNLFKVRVINWCICDLNFLI